MNRLLGTLFALATLAAIAYAILNIGNYTSMCSVSLLASEEVADEELVAEPDSLQMPIVQQDMAIVEADSLSAAEALILPTE